MSCSRVTVLLILLAAPIVAFYAILSASAVNLPCEDDYDSVLRFLVQLDARHSLIAKSQWVLLFQHNEYRLIFESALFAISHGLAGSIDFLPLVFLGNAFVLSIFLALILLWRRPDLNWKERLPVVVLVALLLFQLQYCATLDWAMGSLQNLPVLTFALFSIAALTHSSGKGLVAALLLEALASASSGNGFLLVPIGLFYLLRQKRWRAGLVWLGYGAGISALYFFRYDFASTSRLPVRTSLIEKGMYTLSFLGASVGTGTRVWPCMLLGGVLVLALLVAVHVRYDRRQPGVFWGLVFLGATAAAVSVTRSGFGIEQSLALRYRIYSNLFLILVGLFVFDAFAQLLTNRRTRQHLYAFALSACILFCTVSDWIGGRYLLARRQAMVVEMRAWERHEPLGAQSESRNGNPFLAKRIEQPDDTVLKAAIRARVYSPPSL